MTEDAETLASLTDRAGELAARSDWANVVELYRNALEQVPDNDSARKAEIVQQKAHALHMLALQADTASQFRRLTNEARVCYEQALNAFSTSPEHWMSGKKCHCKAMMAYLAYWTETESGKRKALADEAWANAKLALGVFEAAGKAKEFATVFDQLSYAAAFSYNHDGEAENRENRLKEALSYAEKSIRYLSSLHAPALLARAHAKATGLMVAIERDFAAFSDKDRVDLEAWNHWLKAREISEEEALGQIPYMVILQSWPAACSTDERLSIYLKGKEIAENSRNRFTMGCILDGLAQRKFSESFSRNDPQEIEKLSGEGFEIAKVSKDNLSKVSFVSPNVISVWVPVPEAGYYYSFASAEKDPKIRRELLHKAQEPCREQLRLSKQSGYPDVECAAEFQLGTVLKDLGKTESGIDMKKVYLEEAIAHLKKAIEGDKLIHPTQYYPQGMDLLSLAEAHYELAQITIDVDTKRRVLEEAVLRKEEALDVCEKELTCTQASNPDLSGEIANGYHASGNWAKELCVVASDNSCLPKVARSLEKAVEWYSKAELFSQSAECNWEVAEVYDSLGEFRKASERFELAAEDYKKAAEAVPRLKEFYADHAIYMRAWSEIEQASYHHLRQEPGQAKDHYENASAMHKSSRRWSYLSTNYSAWAKVEHAEDLSRSEKSDRAIEAFEGASRLFQESKIALHDQVAKIEDSDEKQMARDLERAANLRSDYCRARIVVEKARYYDRQGDVSACADKYGQAAELFENMFKELQSDRDKKEVQLMATLSRAWQAMAKAEVETSPDYYENASELFEKARDLSTGEKAKLLVAGHSRFCKALGMGARFIESGDSALHAQATKHLESAADFYLKSGHQKESDFAKASKLLFDGYVHMGKASAEEDPEKKAKMYMMAEKVLRTSADAYEKAQQPSKKEQVLRLLEKVKEEQELALSLTKVIRAPDVFSSTTVFPSPTPSHETSTGLEKFEHADVQITLVVNPKRLVVGQSLEIDAEMTNAGRGAAKLTKLEGLLLDEFEIVDKPEACRIDHNHVNLKGRHLDALRTESIRFVLRPTVRGRFIFKPRLFYVDESGTHRDRSADQVEVTVSEMGLTGWLRGSDRKR